MAGFTTGLAVGAVFLALGSFTAAVFTGTASWIWLVGIIGGLVLLLFALIYQTNFLVWPGVLLFAFSLGAGLLQIMQGKWRI